MKTTRRASLGLALFGAMGLGSVAEAQGVYDGSPSDDVWVYANSGNPGGHPFLLTWGNDGSSVAPTSPPDGYSYSYLKWNLASVPRLAQGQYYHLTDAKLTLLSYYGENYSLTVAQQNPLEARPVATNFDELTWDYLNNSNPRPGNPVFGVGSLANYSATVNYSIPIDLLTAAGAFQSHFNAGIAANQQVGIALTSSMPAAVQGGAFYRLYSKDNIAQRRPVLHVAYEPAITIAGTVTLQSAVSNAQPVTFTFTPTGTGTAFSRTVTLSSSGAFSLADIPLKGYAVGIKGAKWLRSVVTIDASQVPQPTITTTLKAGDANNDNAVDVSDLLLIINHYNQTQASNPNNYLEGADFNNDGTNDVADLLTVIGNYNQVGE